VSGSGFAQDKKKEQEAEHTLQQIKHSDEARREKHKRLAQDIATSLLQQQQLMQVPLLHTITDSITQHSHVYGCSSVYRVRMWR
jgi:hypothetical protein